MGGILPCCFPARGGACQSRRSPACRAPPNGRYDPAPAPHTANTRQISPSLSWSPRRPGAVSARCDRPWPRGIAVTPRRGGQARCRPICPRRLPCTHWSLCARSQRACREARADLGTGTYLDTYQRLGAPSRSSEMSLGCWYLPRTPPPPSPRTRTRWDRAWRWMLRRPCWPRRRRSLQPLLTAR